MVCKRFHYCCVRSSVNMQALFPVIPDEKLANIRKCIIDVMQESRDLELGKIGKSPTVRYYHMTEQEYQDSSTYVFTVFLGKFPESGSETEGFSYDIRKLIRERYITFNQEINYVPIPLSVKRWNYIYNRLGKRMGEISFETGRLAFPLYKHELANIYSGIRNHPTMCSTTEGCVPVSIEKLGTVVGLVHLSDQSKDNRFGKVGSAPVSVTNINVVAALGVTNVEQKKMDLPGEETSTIVGPDDVRVNRVIQQIENELSDIGLGDGSDEAILKKLRSPESRQWIAKNLSQNKSDIQVTGMMFDDLLTALLTPSVVSP